MKIKLTRVTISYPKATVAAVARVDSGYSFEIEDVVISDVAADLSTIFYSSSPKFTLTIKTSKITCDSSYNSDNYYRSFILDTVVFNASNSFFISGGLDTHINI
jgi:hypothetical protein